MGDISEEKLIARLERIAAERLEEIEELELILADEQDKTERYSQQIDEMTDFLADYGLHWVGGDGPTQASLFPRGPTDMKLFNEKIAELNQLADSGPAFQKRDGVNKLSESSIKLTLKEDGFMVNNGELRLYSQPVSSDFFQDIMDGFFPLEFKGRYPEGVRIIVDDQRVNDLFKGQARKLVESARREKRDTKVIDWTKELGEGSGKLKVKLNNGKDILVRTEKTTKISEIKLLVKDHLGIDTCTIAIPPSLENVDEDKTIEQLSLYPRGLLILNM